MSEIAILIRIGLLLNFAKIKNMFSKITVKFLFCLSIGIVPLIGIYSPLKAQNTSGVNVSAKSISTAKKLSEKSKTKAEILDYRGAIADISKAILLNPNEADFYYQRGLILGKLSDRQSAVRDFDNAILLDPNHAWAYLQRAGMSFELGSKFQLTDRRNFGLSLDEDPRRGNSQAMLDLRAARELFQQQGDLEGAKIAKQLIQHFGGS